MTCIGTNHSKISLLLHSEYHTFRLLLHLTGQYLNTTLQLWCLSASVFTLTSLKNLLKTEVSTNCNLNISYKSGHEKLYPGKWDTSQAIITNVCHSELHTPSFPTLTALLFYNTRYNLSTGFWISFSTIPIEFRKKHPFCTILQLPDILQLHSTWTNYHFLHTHTQKKKRIQSSYRIPRSTDGHMCSHRSFNRFWTWTYSLKCKNPLYPLQFPRGNPDDHSRTMCIGQKRIEGDKQLSEYTKSHP